MNSGKDLNDETRLFATKLAPSERTPFFFVYFDFVTWYTPSPWDWSSGFEAVASQIQFLRRSVVLLV